MINQGLLFIFQAASPTLAPTLQPVDLDVGSSIAIWVAFNVILALIPLGITPLFRGFLNAAGGFGLDRKLFRDGELFFYSSTLSAASIGKTFELFLRHQQTPRIYTFLGLLMTLLLSAICFGAAVSVKLNRENLIATNPQMANTLTEGDKRLANASLAVSFLAVVLSFVSFYQGGFK